MKYEFYLSNNLSLKYQRLTPSGCKDIGISKFGFVTKTQFLLHRLNLILNIAETLQ